MSPWSRRWQPGGGVGGSVVGHAGAPCVNEEDKEEFAKRPAGFWIFSGYFKTTLKLQDLMIQTSSEDYQKYPGTFQRYF
jgi:hypothetical protein